MKGFKIYFPVLVAALIVEGMGTPGYAASNILNVITINQTQSVCSGDECTTGFPCVHIKDLQPLSRVSGLLYQKNSGRAVFSAYFGYGNFDNHDGSQPTVQCSKEYDPATTTGAVVTLTASTAFINGSPMLHCTVQILGQ